MRFTIFIVSVDRHWRLVAQSNIQLYTIDTCSVFMSQEGSKLWPSNYTPWDLAILTNHRRALSYILHSDWSIRYDGGDGDGEGGGKLPCVDHGPLNKGGVGKRIWLKVIHLVNFTQKINLVKVVHLVNFSSGKVLVSIQWNPLIYEGVPPPPRYTPRGQIKGDGRESLRGIWNIKESKMGIFNFF